MPQGRNLTRGEESLCQHVFRKSINLRNIEVVKRPKTMHFGGFTPYGRVNMDGNAYEEDYIGEDMFNPPDVWAAHHFLHEVSHSWQHFVGMGMLHHFRLAQKGGRDVRKANGMPFRPAGMKLKDWRSIKFDSVYSYDITSATDLLDFSMEQQCDIIADYFALKLGWMTTAPAKAFGHPIPTQAQLHGVLRNFLADPAYVRDQKPVNEMRARYRMVER